MVLSEFSWCLSKGLQTYASSLSYRRSPSRKFQKVFAHCPSSTSRLACPLLWCSHRHVVSTLHPSAASLLTDWLLLQIQDKDIPILSHLVDIRVVNLRDEVDVSTSKAAQDDEEDDEEGPKVHTFTQTHKFLELSTLICLQP